jgi:hypothetical protein
LGIINELNSVNNKPDTKAILPISFTVKNTKKPSQTNKIPRNFIDFIDRFFHNPQKSKNISYNNPQQKRSFKI